MASFPQGRVPADFQEGKSAQDGLYEDLSSKGERGCCRYDFAVRRVDEYQRWEICPENEDLNVSLPRAYTEGQKSGNLLQSKI